MGFLAQWLPVNNFLLHLAMAVNWHHDQQALCDKAHTFLDTDRSLIFWHVLYNVWKQVSLKGLLWSRGSRNFRSGIQAGTDILWTDLGTIRYVLERKAV